MHCRRRSGSWHATFGVADGGAVRSTLNHAIVTRLCVRPAAEALCSVTGPLFAEDHEDFALF